MARLQIEIGDKLHRVVYIDYNDDGIPHQVMTTRFVSTADEPYWRLYWWDFFANNGDKNDIRAYNSGSGGTHKEIQAPQWADGYIGKYWVADDAKFKGKPKNAKRLKNPIPVADYFGKKSINPFKVAEITHNIEYCDRCGHSSTEFCDEHKYWDENDGVGRYIDDDLCAD
jgi:hypothetical protein